MIFLNRTAAFVWRQCEGRTLHEVSRELAAEVGCTLALARTWTQDVVLALAGSDAITVECGDN
jgi:hypothetical protein